MKFYVISDNIDTAMGMRMAGIEGEVVHTADEVITALKNAVSNTEIGIIAITKLVQDICYDEILKIKQTTTIPLIVEIPDRHGEGNVAESISDYVNSAIGFKI